MPKTRLSDVFLADISKSRSGFSLNTNLSPIS